VQMLRFFQEQHGTNNTLRDILPVGLVDCNSSLVGRFNTTIFGISVETWLDLVPSDPVCL